MTNVFMTYNGLEKAMKNRDIWKANEKGGKLRKRWKVTSSTSTTSKWCCGSCDLSTRLHTLTGWNILEFGRLGAQRRTEEIRATKPPISDWRRHGEKHERLQDNGRVKRKKSKGRRSREENRRRKRGYRSGDWSRPDDFQNKKQRLCNHSCKRRLPRYVVWEASEGKICRNDHHQPENPIDGGDGGCVGPLPSSLSKISLHRSISKLIIYPCRGILKYSPSNYKLSSCDRARMALFWGRRASWRGHWF